MAESTHIGLVGCGRWGANILRDLLALGARVTVVAVDVDTAERAGRGGAQAVVAAIHELPAVAGAVVATPSATHAEVVEELLARNIPIFVEKPMTIDAASATSIAARAGERVFVMDKWRFHPGVEMLREIARTGELGRVNYLLSTRTQWGQPHADTDGIWILAPHELSIAYEILGHLPEPRAAAAEVSGGRADTMTALMGKDPWFRFEVSARHHIRRRETALHCENGIAVLSGSPDGAYESLTIHRDRGGELSVEKRPLSERLPLFAELSAFLDHLNGGPPPKSSAAEGAAVVSAVAELRRLAGIEE